MAKINPFVLASPRLPRRRATAWAAAAAASVLYFAAALAGAYIVRHTVLRPTASASSSPPAATIVRLELPDIVYRATTARPLAGGGGGGGGNRQAGPIRRASGVGKDPLTLRVGKPPALAAVPAHTGEGLPTVDIDAKPMLSGTFDAPGLPGAGVDFGTSTGPGSGGGVGDGVGTGIGSGRGPGLGPGEGGGTGGGVYRPGGGVTPPRLLSEVQPVYTNDALARRIQGTVVLEVIVRRDGCASNIRVVRSLDAGGLDQAAVAAVSQWRFEPGRLAGRPVDVVATIMVDFSIR